MPLFEELKANDNQIKEEEEDSRSDFKHNENLNTGETMLDTEETRNS